MDYAERLIYADGCYRRAMFICNAGFDADMRDACAANLATFVAIKCKKIVAGKWPFSVACTNKLRRAVVDPCHWSDAAWMELSVARMYNSRAPVHTVDALEGSCDLHRICA